MRHRTAAYVMDRAGLTFRNEDAALLDQLNFSFALVRDGLVSGAHWQSIDSFKAYVAGHPHILPVVSVGGWGADGFSQAAATADGRQRFVESTLELMQTHGFLGVDIDWEYPCSAAAGIVASLEDKQNFTLLLRALRDGLDELSRHDGKKRLLACALGASPALADCIECAAVGALVDQVNLMTYDMYSSGVCSHHTAMYSSHPDYPVCGDLAVRTYTVAEIPADKIMLGCAMYGRQFQLNQHCCTPLFSPSPSSGCDTVNYRLLRNDPAYTLHFDTQAKAAYALSKNAFVSLDSVESIAYKRAYAEENRLMGLMCWEYGGDVQGELLQAMHG